MSERDPTVPPLLYCDRCRKQQPWEQRGGQFFCAACDTRNGLTVKADDERRADRRKERR